MKVHVLHRTVMVPHAGVNGIAYGRLCYRTCIQWYRNWESMVPHTKDNGTANASQWHRIRESMAPPKGINGIAYVSKLYRMRQSMVPYKGGNGTETEGNGTAYGSQWYIIRESMVPYAKQFLCNYHRHTCELLKSQVRKAIQIVTTITQINNYCLTTPTSQ